MIHTGRKGRASRDYSQRNATRGLYGSISSAARRKGMTSGATASGTRSPASAIPSGSLRDDSVCASASRLRLAALIAAELDGPASIAAREIVMVVVVTMMGRAVGGGAIYTPLERMGTDGGMEEGDEVECGCRGGGATAVFGFDHPPRKQGILPSPLLGEPSRVMGRTGLAFFPRFFEPRCFWIGFLRSVSELRLPPGPLRCRWPDGERKKPGAVARGTPPWPLYMLPFSRFFLLLFFSYGFTAYPVSK